MIEFATRIVVPPEHPSLPGHFPGNPIVPGVVLLDLVLHEIQAALPEPTRLTVIPSAKFQRPVRPAEVVDVQVRITDGEHPQTFRARFQATVGGSPAAEGAFILAIDTAAANATSHG
jgi:3-hydroxyacyl-[acyl-carrier-protein] dehydratase